MNKAYIIFPFAGLLIFLGFYLNFKHKYNAEEEVRKQQALEEKIQHAREEQARREQAYKDALVAAEKRRQEREERQRKEEEEKVRLQRMIDERDRAVDEVNKRLKPQLERVKKDLSEAKDEVAKLQQQKEQYLKEEDFVRKYTAEAEANRRAYGAVLNTLDDIEKKRAELEKAEAAARK